MTRSILKLVVLPSALALAACGGGKPQPAPAPASQQAAPAADPFADMDAQYLLDLAMVHQRHKGFDRALEALNRALEIEQDAAQKAQIQMRLGEVLQAAGRGDEALKAYESATSGLTDKDEQTRVQLRLGQQYRQAKRFAEAEKALQTAYAAATQPYLKDSARSELLQVWSAQGLLKDKIAELEKKLAAAPTDRETMRLLAVAYGQGGDAGKAVELFKKLVAAEPEETSHLQNLGNFSFQAGAYKEGIDAFMKLAEKAPHARAQAYERIASGYASLKQNGEATKWAAKLGELASDKTPYMFVQQGNLYGRLGQNDKAVEAFNKAIEAAGTPAQKEDFRFQLATFYVGQKQLDDAAKILGELASGPGSDQLKQNAQRLLDSVKTQKVAGAAPAPTPVKAPANP